MAWLHTSTTLLDQRSKMTIFAPPPRRWPNVDKHRARVDRIRAAIGRIRANVFRDWPSLGQIWAKQGANMERVRTNAVRCRADLDRVRAFVVEYGRVRAEFDRTPDNVSLIWVNVGRHWCSDQTGPIWAQIGRLARHCPTFEQFGKNSSRCDRSCPNFGRLRAMSTRNEKGPFPFKAVDRNTLQNKQAHRLRAIEPEAGQHRSKVGRSQHGVGRHGPEASPNKPNSVEARPYSIETDRILEDVGRIQLQKKRNQPKPERHQSDIGRNQPPNCPRTTQPCRTKTEVGRTQPMFG